MAESRLQNYVAMLRGKKEQRAQSARDDHPAYELAHSDDPKGPVNAGKMGIAQPKSEMAGMATSAEESQASIVASATQGAIKNNADEIVGSIHALSASFNSTITDLRVKLERQFKILGDKVQYSGKGGLGGLMDSLPSGESGGSAKPNTGGKWGTFKAGMKRNALLAGVMGVADGAMSWMDASGKEERGEITKDEADRKKGGAVGKGLGTAAGVATGATLGEMAGGALGALGGPLAPITVPAGMLLGGLAGGALGGWLGDKGGEWAGEKAVDAYKGTRADKPTKGVDAAVAASVAAATAASIPSAQSKPPVADAGPSLGKTALGAMLPGAGAAMALGGMLSQNTPEQAKSVIASQSASVIAGQMQQQAPLVGSTANAGDLNLISISPEAQAQLNSIVANGIAPLLDSAGRKEREDASFTQSLFFKMGAYGDLMGDIKDSIVTRVGGLASAAWAGVKAAGGSIVSGAKEGYQQAGVVGSLAGGVGSVLSGNAFKAAGTATSGAMDVARQKWSDADGKVAASAGIAKGRWSKEEMDSISNAQNAGAKFSSGKGLDQTTKDKITAKATAMGIPPEHLMAMTQMESGGNPNAVSAEGAAGLGQFTSRTAKQYGVTNRFDVDQNIDAMARLYADNKKGLEARGIEGSLDNIYLAHQQGLGGASKILSGNIDDKTRANMDLNVGKGQGRDGFLAANQKALSAASAKVQKTTVADGTYASTTKSMPTAVASATNSSTFGPTMVGKPQAVGTAPVAVRASSALPTALAASAPTVASARSADIPETPKKFGKEMQQVEVANMPQPVTADEQMVQRTSVAQSSNGGPPYLSDIPTILHDLGLILVNQGLV